MNAYQHLNMTSRYRCILYLQIIVNKQQSSTDNITVPIKKMILMSNQDEINEIFKKQKQQYQNNYNINQVNKSDENSNKIENSGKFNQDNRQFCCILYGYTYLESDWCQIINQYSKIIDYIQIYHFQGKDAQQTKQIKPPSIYKNTKQIMKELKNLTDAKKQNNNNQYTLVGTLNDDRIQYAKLTKAVISFKEEEQRGKIHVYYLPFLNKNSQSSQLIKTEYSTTKFLQVLNQYVSLDSKTVTMYKDSGHRQFQTLIYSGKIAKFNFYVTFSQQQCYQLIKNNSVISNKAPQATKYISETLNFVGKLSEISLADKHLLEEIDLSLTQYKQELRKVYIEENRLRKSLSGEKNKLAEQIQYLVELLDLRELYPQKIKFSTIDTNMLKRIRNQNVEKKTNWIKDQSVVYRNLDVRLNQLSRIKQEYLSKQISQKITQNQEIQGIRKQIIQYQRYIKSQQQKNKSQEYAMKNASKLINSKFSINLNNNKNNNNNINKNTNKRLLTPKQTKQSIYANENNNEKYENISLEGKQLQIQMLKAEFMFEKQFKRKKNQYLKASEDLLNYITHC